MKINQTKDYGLFKLTLDNREVREKRVKKLLPSMRQYGWLPSHPMLVRRDGSHFLILDGQGRFHAAKILGIPVLYVVTTMHVSIPKVNEGQSPWGLVDYVGSYSQQGHADYHYLQEFSKRHKLPVSQCAQILRGGVAVAGNANDAIKSGKFKATDVEYAERVATVVSALAAAHPCARTSNFINAVSRVLNVTELDMKRLIDSIYKRPELVGPRASCDAYVELLEVIYNFSAKQKRLPLAFLTKEVMAKRKATFGKQGKRSK
jgi:hypothetical protein